MNHGYAKELVILTADIDAENALLGLLRRHSSLQTRPLSCCCDLHRHPLRDSGCRGDAEEFLRGFQTTHHYAIVIFDHHGCGWEDRWATEIEADVERRLSASGWKDRCCAIVLEPELEIWVWSDSPHVARELGWSSRQPPLREWLISKQLLSNAAPKPSDPKRAMLEALRVANKPPSPAIFRALADNVGLARCNDRGFLKLKSTLQRWFPA